MMYFEDFYEIASYGNEAWKGCFTPKEVACNAYNYLCEFKSSKANGEPTHTTKALMKLLAEDGSEEAREWLYQMTTELNLTNVDWKDYLETDEWLKKFI